MNLHLFRKITTKGIQFFLYFLIVFTLVRVLFLVSYGDFSALKDLKMDLLKAFEMGARFDVSAISYTFLPVFIFWLISLFIKRDSEDKFERAYGVFTKIYLVFSLVITVSMLGIDYYFYKFFTSHINILVFGIFDDDTTAVMKSVWTDYPILRILLVYLAVIWVFLIVHKRVMKQDIERNESGWWYALLLIFPLAFVGIRGSVGLFPLRRDYTNVSKNTFVNSLCYNGFYSLIFAKYDYDENKITPDTEAVLRGSGYKSVMELVGAYSKEAVDSVGGDFYAKTGKNDFLKKNPPNVIFVLVESMSNHYFEISNEKMDLLGELGNQLWGMYYFKNGISSFNGTIASLENLLISTPKVSMAQSKYFTNEFSSSVARPFKEQGYKTYFLTGAKVSWRNIDKFLEHQGYDVIEGDASINSKISNTKSFAWGVHDEYLFDYIKMTLEQKSKSPKFIFALTVSSHTPYSTPNIDNGEEIEISEEYLRDFNGDKELAQKHLKAFKYACDSFGKLIKSIKNSPYGENTIIVATGDHNAKHLNYAQGRNFIQKSVPILFYIPEKYKPEFFDDKEIASHKDIFPTIFNLALSEQRYVYGGDNLFKKSDKERFGVNDYNYIASERGVLQNEGGKYVFYNWVDGSKRVQKIGDSEGEDARKLKEKLELFTNFQTLQIYEDINKNTNKK